MLWGTPAPARSHLAQLVNATLVDHIQIHVCDLFEEDIPHLGEALAGWHHQSLQDGWDVGLDVVPHAHLCLGEDEGCMGRERILLVGSAWDIIHPPIIPTHDIPSWMPEKLLVTGAGDMN